MNYTINLLGDAGVGKTAWIRRMKSDSFKPQYIASVGCDIHSMNFNTNYGTITLNFHDYAGQEKYSSLQKIVKSDLSVLMFDLTSKISYKNTKHWEEGCGLEPVLFVGNKCDVNEESIKVIPRPRENYVAVSAKTMKTTDLVTPILRILTGHLDICVV